MNPVKKMDTYPCEKIVTKCAKSVTEKPVPTASHSMVLMCQSGIHHCRGLELFIHYFNMLISERQNNVLSATLTYLTFRRTSIKYLTPFPSFSLSSVVRLLSSVFCLLFPLTLPHTTSSTNRSPQARQSALASFHASRKNGL